MAVDFEVIGRIAPRNYVKSFDKMLLKAGMDLSGSHLLGALIIAGIALSFLFVLLLYNLEYTHEMLVQITKAILQVLEKLNITIDYSTNEGQVIAGGLLFAMDVIISFICGLGIIFLGMYTIIVLRIDNRKSKVEEILPDFLLLASSNVRAGMTIDQALWYAAKPEFGTLSLEIEQVARRVFTGDPFDEAIDLLAVRLESKSVKRVISLIKQGIASGGEIASILEITGEEARKMQLIKKEIATSLLMYIIFIVFAAAIATPFLYSISHQLLLNLEGIAAELPQTDTSVMSGGGSYGGITNIATVFHFGTLPVSSNEFLLFALFAIFVTAILSSLIIGVIRHGSKVRGFKYIPFMIIVSYLVFVISEAVLEQILGVIAL